VTENQIEDEGKVRAVHVIPSVDEAAAVEPRATAAKIPVVGLTVTDCQVEDEGKVRAVHVIPSVDEAASVEF
jgi:ABC-type branched-subunit amino acid transport system substrate-binding protein